MSSATHTNVANGATVQLIAANCWKTGYGNAGWNTLPDGRGTSYGPNETITAPNTMNTAGMVLYANWIASAGNMQSWTGCSSLATGAVTALKDTRDNNVYAVAKLADNKCWSIENLRLSSGTVNSSTTHNPISSFAWTASTASWCSSSSASCMNKVVINTNNINSALTASPTGDNNTSYWYSYGTYYNWYAATAGRGTYSTADGTTVEGDICPAGWHLPAKGADYNTGEFKTMYDAIGATPADIRKYPNNFIWSGRHQSSSAYFRGTSGSYWTSSENTDVRASHLWFNNSGSVEPLSNNGYEYYGFSVRCIAG